MPYDGGFRPDEVCVNVFGGLAGAVEQYQRRAANYNEFGLRLSRRKLVGQRIERSPDVVGGEWHVLTLAWPPAVRLVRLRSWKFVEDVPAAQLDAVRWTIPS